MRDLFEQSSSIILAFDRGISGKSGGPQVDKSIRQIKCSTGPHAAARPLDSVQLGAPETAAQRLNFAQAFNRLGSISGALIGTVYIFSGVELNSSQIAAMQGEHIYSAYLRGETMRVVETVNGIDHPHANDMTVEEMNQKVREEYGSQSDAIISAYRKSYPKATPLVLYATIATPRWRFRAFAQAGRKAALAAAPAYAYIYSWRTPVLDNRPGTFHAAELPFVFDNNELLDHYGAGDPAASVLNQQMSEAWVSFARTDNPNHSGLPTWLAYTADARATMIFNAPCEVRNDPEGKGLRIITQS